MRGADLILAACLAALPAAAQDLPALYSVTGVAANDVLNIRALPSASASILSELAPDARNVEVTAISADGRWARVNTWEWAGWAALRYLERQPQPHWSDPGTPLACHGTEPFWSFRVDAAEGRFDTPEGVLPPVAVTARATAIGDRTLGLTLSRGFAVVRAQECSDGMSDRAFGLAIDLFLQDDGTLAGYSGCCSLMP